MSASELTFGAVGELLACGAEGAALGPFFGLMFMLGAGPLGQTVASPLPPRRGSAGASSLLRVAACGGASALWAVRPMGRPRRLVRGRWSRLPPRTEVDDQAPNGRGGYGVGDRGRGCCGDEREARQSLLVTS